MTITERVRAGVLARITCPCCGNRITTVAELYEQIRSANTAALPSSLTPSTLGTFLRGSLIRSDALDVLDAFAVAIEPKQEMEKPSAEEPPDTLPDTEYDAAPADDEPKPDPDGIPF